MPIDYQALQSGVANVQTPDEGHHVARLERAALVHTDKGERLVTEWSSDRGDTYWTSWNRFDETGFSYTIELLDGLGVDRSMTPDDDALTGELDRVVGGIFDVSTKSQQGSRGDGRVFVTTYVNGRAEAAQEQMDVDIPADREGLPQPDSAAAKLQDDEKIPF